ncbi:hypothetical protein HanRHA438_Chr03g0099341 [Helianthus annuus]|nr:hypothetical protein HanRHA438_Chr03g0099341 [Helianthus annuus]
MAKHMLQFALFAAFSLWLLYQIRQPTGEVGAGSQLSNDRLSNFMGRKGSAGLSKSTVNPHSGLTLEDVTNPGEEGEIPQYSKEIESVEFHTNTGSSKEGNDQNTLLQEESLTMKKSNISFPDEMEFPNMFVTSLLGKSRITRSTTPVFKSQSQSQSVIATRVGKGRNGAVEES